MTPVAGIQIPHPEKVLFPDGTTKAALAGYYGRIAEVMLPHVRGRPLHMQRYPDGIEGEEIQQKQAPSYLPDFVSRVRVPRKRGGHRAGRDRERRDARLPRGAGVRNPAHVVVSHGIAGEPRRAHLRPRPIRQRAGCDARRGADVAELLHAVGLRAYLKSTGSRGFHVVAPLDGRAGFDETRAFARSVAERVIDRDPERFTIEQRKENRRGRVYLDLGRNAYAQTAVAPYAVRALAEAPVATPLEWGELARAHPRRFTIHNIFRRMARRRDPWSDSASGRGRLSGPARSSRSYPRRSGGPPRGSAATAARRRRSPRPARSPRTGGR